MEFIPSDKSRYLFLILVNFKKFSRIYLRLPNELKDIFPVSRLHIYIYNLRSLILNFKPFVSWTEVFKI